ncbi:hypothetical protein [Lysobacter gummosus]|uniref:Uncharacterized protein n=1 Tax=Lysobacter gummosus TaxID=262324 RepID=A0ABY3XEQ6_9GAMM|nr:hypothetical protein [Lysobacter gummosus]UNP29258.1 hypothetical protein MOV92_22775 [Lysobacter gummosus]
MNQSNMISDAELRSLSDYVERILRSGHTFSRPDARLTLFACFALASILAERTDTIRTRRLDPKIVARLVAECRRELAPVERAIDETGSWDAKRWVPSEMCEDESALRWLHDEIARCFEGLEPEFVGLPVHQLNRAVQQARLMQVWDVADAKYQPSLRAAIRHLEQAIMAAMCAPHN